MVTELAKDQYPLPSHRVRPAEHDLGPVAPALPVSDQTLLVLRRTHNSTFTNNAGFKAARFDWDAISPIQSVYAPFTVTLTARTNANAVANNYNGAASLTGLTTPGGTTVSISPTSVADFVNGIWSGQVTVLQASTGMVLRAFDVSGVAGTSSVFNVSPSNDLVVTVSDCPDPC